ncbi:MAG: LuxR C-terminal-related transcriptional regulator [Rhizobiaceae bacterium]
MEHVPKGKNGGPLENTALKTLQQIQVTPALGESSYDAISRRLESVSTLSDAFSCVSDMCTRYGFSHFMIAHPPDVGCSMVADDILLTNLPLYLVDDLISLDMFDDWSVLTHLNTTSTPFIWSKRNGIVGDGDGDGGSGEDEGAKLTGADALIASEIDTQFAHCIQTPTRGQKRAFIILYSEALEEFDITFELVVLFQNVFNRIETLAIDRVRDTGSELNKRELECLNWAAAGKTSGEIAVIVSLSEHTVNHYLNSCCKKLDCVNRTQAVARAIRTRVIK